MKSKISGLDWLKLGVVWVVFGIAFSFWDSVSGSFLWAYLMAVILFRIDSYRTLFLALGLLILSPMAMFFGLDTLSESLVVNMYLLLCIFFISEIWNNLKLSFSWLENISNQFVSKLSLMMANIPNWVSISSFGLISLGLVSRSYFFNFRIPYNSFLDMGALAVQTNSLEQAYIGWAYQFGRIWNFLTSNWPILYTEFLAWITGNFYLGIKLHQFLSIVLGAMGVIMLWRAIISKSEDRVASISAQVLAALVYALNPFFLSILNGVVEFGVAYSLIPWVIWSWLKLIHNKEGKWWQVAWQVILTGVILSFTTVASGITLVFTNVIPLGVIMLGVSLIEISSKREIFQRGILFLLVWMVVGLMALHTIVPTFWGYRQSDRILDDSQTAERASAFVKDFYSPTLEEIAYLQNKEGIVSEEIGYDFRAIPLKYRLIWLFWVSLGAGSVIWFKRNKYILPIWLGSGLAGYLALGYSQSWLYRVLNEYFPYFWGLRTPGRFMMIFALGVSILGAMIWYYIFKEAKVRAWRLSAVSIFGLTLVMIIISARHQEFEMRTFATIESMDYHFPEVEEAKKSLDRLNSNMEYRILDLTRDNDGSWNHTRVVSINQRYINDFEKVLIRYPAKDWTSVLRNYNVRYIVASTYDDYCDDRFSDDIYNNRNLVSCYLLEQKSKLKVIDDSLENYIIYEVNNVKPYISGEGIDQNFSYNPIVKTGDEEQKVVVAEAYSPQFKWTCNEGIEIESSPERNGLVQVAILPANSECKFGYYKSRSVLFADMSFVGLIISTILGGIVYFVSYIAKLWYNK